MEMTNKNKEEIEKIEKGCRRCYNLGWENERICGEKGFLCPKCKTKLKATIKTSIEWCENEIEFLSSQYCQCGCCEDIIPNNPKFDERLEQLKTHLAWLKEQEKE